MKSFENKNWYISMEIYKQYGLQTIVFTRRENTVISIHWQEEEKE